MKRCVYLLVACVIISLTSCTEDKAVSAQLETAEKLMEQAPDSSLAILQQIEEPKKLSDKQYALWCLLFTQAQDKNYITHTSDSLIQIAVNYFEKKKDIPHLMKAYYYNAVVYHDLGDSPRAQDFYLKALDAGKESNNYALLGRIYGNLGTLYTYQNLLEPAIDYQRRAVEIFSIVNDTASTGMALRNIGRNFTKYNQFDSAIIYYLQSLPFLSEMNQFSIYNELANLYKRQEKFSEANEYITLALANITKYDDPSTVYYNLGDLYRLTKQSDSAYHYLYLSLNSPKIYTKAGANLSLSYLEENHENWKESVQYKNQHISLYDSINEMMQAENLQRVHSNYNYQKETEQRIYHEKASQKKTIYIYFIVIIFIVSSMGSTLYYLRKKQINKEKHDKELRVREQKYKQSQQYIEEKEEEIRKLKETTEQETNKLQKELLASQKQILDNEIAHNEQKRNLQRRWNQEFKNGLFQELFESGSGKLTKENWTELEIWIDRIYPDMVHYLKNALPTIDDEKLKVCYLVKIGLPVKQICILLNRTSSAISKRKERLFEKLTGEKGSAKDLDTLLAEMFDGFDKF